MADRVLLPQNYLLKGGMRTYRIEQFISAGSNAVVYQASYQDTLMPEHSHTVLIKELYPLDSSGLIVRDDYMNLVVPKASEALFLYHKQSFLLGNQAHLALSEDGGGRIAENLDSFEANHTLYTVLASRKGRVLSELLQGKPAFSSLTDTVLCLQSLLHALQPFHQNQLLHLDISPDNIFTLAPDSTESAGTDVILLDFNSVYSLDNQIPTKGEYYLGKPAYTAPEVTLHQEGSLGPWTDLYSVTAVFYEMLTGETLPADRELLDLHQLVSPYSGLLLHEKEASADLTNTILWKGLQILTEERYQGVSEMLKDVNKLLGILNGSITDYVRPAYGTGKKKWTLRKKIAVFASAFIVAASCCMVYLNFDITFTRRPEKDTLIDLTQIPLDRDDSIVLTQIDKRDPLEDNILNLPILNSTMVRITLKDFQHERDLSEAYLNYNICSFYSGRDDKRGWQLNNQVYDFFESPDNSAHMVLNFQDTNPFDLEYVGMMFFDYNEDNASVLLDITKYTLIDGKGNSFEMTDMLGGHIIHFDEQNIQWNLMSTQSTDFVKTFADMYGGKILVNAEINRLAPLLEVTWESDNPDVATVDQKGVITAVALGQAKITVTVRDKTAGTERSTQLLVNATHKYTSPASPIS